MPSSKLKDVSTTAGESKGSFDPSTQSYTNFGRGFETRIAIDDEGIKSLVNELVEEKIKSLREEKDTLLEFKKIDDALAGREIECFLLELKEENVSKISILDIATNLKLPADQVERIMEKFEEEGRVSELNE